MTETDDPTNEPGELQYVEDFLDAHPELIDGIVTQLVANGTAEYATESGRLTLVGHRHRWRSQWLDHEFTTPDGRAGNGSVRLSRNAFDPPQRSLRFYVAAHLADMEQAD